MNITQHTDYALRLLIYLDACPERRVTIREVAERFDISRSHLMKIVTQLVTEGFVDGTRGKGGGLRLARPAERIVLGDVIRKVEPGFELVECFGEHSRCILNTDCRLRSALQNALQAFLRSLDTVTLADLGAPRPQLRQTLGIVELIRQPS